MVPHGNFRDSLKHVQLPYTQVLATTSSLLTVIQMVNRLEQGEKTSAASVTSINFVLTQQHGCIFIS